jgi:hypothetical protein
MSVFLLEYDPATGEVVHLDVFEEGNREAAMRERLRREKENVRAGLDRELVLLDAVSEAALRSTHSRYFKSLRELAEAARSPAES